MGSAAQYLVLIDTGAKQSFIFGTNKRRANVGASELIRRVGTDWINEACKGKPGVATIISASGTAMLKVEDRSVGEGVAHAQALLRAGLGPSAEAVSVRGAEDGEVVMVETQGRLRLILPWVGDASLPLHAQAAMTKEHFRRGRLP